MDDGTAIEGNELEIDAFGNPGAEEVAAPLALDQPGAGLPGQRPDLLAPLLQSLAQLLAILLTALRRGGGAARLVETGVSL